MSISWSFVGMFVAVWLPCWLFILAYRSIDISTGSALAQSREPSFAQIIARTGALSFFGMTAITAIMHFTGTIPLS